MGQFLLYKRTIGNRETIILDHPHLVGEVDCQSFVKASFQRFQRMAEVSISSVSVIKGRNETPIETDTLPIMRTAVQRY